MTHTTVVTGDITVDWMLAKLPATIAEPRWSSEIEAKTFRQAGGAALLAKLIQADAARLAHSARRDGTDGSWDVHGPNRSHFGRCAWTAVALGHSGAVLVPGEPNAGADAQLVFEPGCIKGERERRLEWRMLGDRRVRWPRWRTRCWSARSAPTT